MFYEEFNRWRHKRFRSIIVVGTAEGYYFSGLLRFARFDQIVGFEMDDGLREICNHNAKKNCQGKNFSLLGTCFIEELKQTTRGNDLILMDCEGEEETLLNPNEIPSLYKTEIIVECHDIFRPKITETLQKRFSNSFHPAIVIYSILYSFSFSFTTLASQKIEPS